MMCYYLNVHFQGQRVNMWIEVTWRPRTLSTPIQVTILFGLFENTINIVITNDTHFTIIFFKSYIRTYICTVCSSMRNSDAVSTLGNLPRSKKVSVIKISSGRWNKIEKIKELLQNGAKYWPGICLISWTVPEIPGRMVTFTLIRVIQYCVRPEWWKCMHVFQQTAVGVLRSIHIPAEPSWNVTLQSSWEKIFVHIFVIAYEWQFPRWCSLCWQRLCEHPASEWSFVKTVSFVVTNAMLIQDEIRRTINS